jgi:F-type H+-transporting ATPase subunit delta
MILPMSWAQKNKGVFVSATASITAGASGRYAIALFEIAKEAKTLAAIEADLDSLQAALDESADLRDVISSPLLSREEQGKAMRALTDKMALGAEAANTVALMAENRRLYVLPEMISQVKALAADDRGEVSAEVTAAKALTETQSKALAAALKKSVGKDVNVNVTVDKDLIGGLIVKVGSLMIDSTLRSKLNNLQNAMKEVG